MTLVGNQLSPMQVVGISQPPAKAATTNGSTFWAVKHVRGAPHCMKMFVVGDLSPSGWH